MSQVPLISNPGGTQALADEASQDCQGRKVREEEVEQLYLPECAVEDQTRKFFLHHGLGGDESSMADFCGPCHKLARRACALLLLSEAIGVLLGWHLKAPAWLIVVYLQPFNALVLYLEWKCLGYVLLPWQHSLMKNGSSTFRLPGYSSFLRTDFREWAFGISLMSLVVVVSLQNQAVNLGKDLQYGMDFIQKGINISCFIATFVGFLWVIVWSQPISQTRWDFDRDRENEPKVEIRYETLASKCGLSKWQSTHYEALIRYAQYCGMFGVQQMTNSLQEAEASLLWYAAEDFERKCCTRIQTVMRFNFAMVVCRVLLRTVPQVYLSAWRYHTQQTWLHLGSLGINLVVFFFSDCYTFLIAEAIYGEFTSRLLADRTAAEYSNKCKQMLDSSEKFHHGRLGVMAVSAGVVWLCLCLVLADLMCLVLPTWCDWYDVPGAGRLNLTIPLAGCLLAAGMIIIGVSINYLLEPVPLWEPPPRKDKKKLYVDEDKPQYYWHVPGSPFVTMIQDGGCRHEHCGEEEGCVHGGRRHYSYLKVPKGEPFVDSKLLRVRESGQQSDIPKLTKERENFLLNDATQSNWFELALRFGKELTPYQWRQEVRRHPQRKMVKLLGFDGGHAMQSAFVSRATNELLDHDVVLWDGDWFCEEGWTGMIKTFLKAKPRARAVAFQKHAEVPGFHRSYWKLYQTFPNRIQIVVLKDVGSVCPEPILKAHDWLEKKFVKGDRDPNDNDGLLRPERVEGEDPKKYLTVALLGRKIQGETKVIAMNGGNITTALAALETSDNNVSQRVHWTVYSAWREEHNKNEKTLLGYASNHETKYLSVFQTRSDKERQTCNQDIES